MKKKKKELNLKQFLVSKLRSACMRWPPYYETLNRAKTEISLLRVTPLQGGNFLCEGQIVDGRPGFNTVQFFSWHNPKLGRRLIYQCEQCKGFYLKKDKVKLKNGKTKMVSMVAVDHIFPVTGGLCSTSWDWNIYITQMFREDGRYFQVLCRLCHSQKTQQEREDKKNDKKI
jgi:hypothetical protein